MMNSYHYCYYYCYGYDEYPSYCCCSILLNDFLSLDEHDLLHLETSLIFSVPQKDYSNGGKKNKQPSLSAICILSQTSRHSTLLISATDTTATLVSLTMDFTNVAQRLEHDVHSDLLYLSWWPLLFPSCVRTMHAIVLVGLFQPLSPQSVIVCSPNRILSLISSQMWLINLIVTLNWTTTALLHQWCPWCPAH